MSKTRKEEKSTRAFMVHDLDSELIKQFKINCMKRDLTMKEGLIDALTDWNRKN